MWGKITGWLKKSNLRFTKRFLILLLLLIVLIAVTLFVVYRPKASKTSNSSSSILVEITNVKQQTIPVSITALGSLEADQSVDVSPEIEGQVASIHFHNGQQVKRGRLLFQLDDSIAQAQLTAAVAKLKLSKEDLRRGSRLLKHDALSQQAVDQAEEAVAEDEATLHEKQVRVEKMQLRAPFNGTVGSRTVSVGQYVTVGQTLVSLVNDGSLKAIYNVAQTYLPQLKLGQTVELTSDALAGESFSGTVSYISPSIDVATRTVEVHATIPNNAHQLAPGMFVKISQELSERQNALVVPAEALVATISGSEVYVIKNGRAVETPVQVGARWNDMVEITDGLKVNEAIVNVGQQKLRDGSQVQVITPQVMP